MLVSRLMSKPLLRAEHTRRALLLGAGALLAECSGKLHGMRRRVGFAVVNERLLMHGRIASRTLDEFREVMRQNPQITTIVMQEMEGARDDAPVAALGRELRVHGLATALQSDSYIVGGAVPLFLAGTDRRMVEGARIGLSNWSKVDRAYVEEMLGSDGFYQFALQVGATDRIHEMTAQEIAQYGLLTEPVKVWN